jgi:hypothetical protein
MFTHTAERLITTDPAQLPSAIDAFVARSWGSLAVPVSDDHPRTFSIRTDTEDPAPDVWLTFRIEPAGSRTRLRVSLDELDPGPDPTPALVYVLDLLVAAIAETGQQV